MELLLGIAQGSPNSTLLFSVLLNDLHDVLASEGLGISVGSISLCILLVCFVFVDDIVLILSSVVQVEDALHRTWKYGLKWGLSFSMPKAAVLAFNTRDAPATWNFGPHKIVTKSLKKYLAVRFNDRLHWSIHFRVKLAAVETPRAAVALEGELGRGQSGVVTRGTLPGAGKRSPRRPVAIKQAAMPGRFNASHEERSTIDTALMVEGLLLLGLQHLWVVRVVGIVTDSTPCMVCTELMPHGDLKNFLRACRCSTRAVLGQS